MRRETFGFLLRALPASGLLLRLGGVGLERLPSVPALALTLVLAHGLALLVADPGPSVSRRLLRWGNAISTHRFAIGLACLVAVGVLYRVFDIGADIGSRPTGIDERRLANSVRFFLRTGRINHETVEHYPGIHFWILTGVYLMTYLRALMSGVAETFRDVPLDTFVVVGRLTSSMLAAGTIVMTGVLGRVLHDERTGLLAAGVIAISPLAERVSTALRNDETMVMLVLAAATVSMVHYRSTHARWSFVAGGLAGAAAAVKYSGVFALGPALLAVVLRPPGGSRVRDLALAIAGFGVVLAVTNHYLWADVPNLVRQLSDQIGHLGPGHWGATDNPAWAYTSTIAESGTG